MESMNTFTSAYIAEVKFWIFYSRVVLGEEQFPQLAFPPAP